MLAEQRQTSAGSGQQSASTDNAGAAQLSGQIITGKAASGDHQRKGRIAQSGAGRRHAAKINQKKRAPVQNGTFGQIDDKAHQTNQDNEAAGPAKTIRVWPGAPLDKAWTGPETEHHHA